MYILSERLNREHRGAPWSIVEHKRSSDVLEVSKRLLEVSIGDVLFIRRILHTGTYRVLRG